MELWRCVVGYENIYEISNKGNVRSVARLLKRRTDNLPTWKKGYLLKPFNNGRGYRAVHLEYRGVRKSKYVHRLVLEAFTRSPKQNEECHHIDNNRENNSLENLQWLSCSDNLKHRTKHGTWGGEKVNFCKLKEQDVIFIRNSDLSRRELANRFNVTKTNIDAIIWRKSWKHLS